MTPDASIFLATIIVLFPMWYLLLAAPGFLFIGLDKPTVGLLLRSMFSGYFLALIVASAIAATILAATAHFFLAGSVAVMAALAVPTRRWLLQRMDVAVSQINAGDAEATRQLRRLHWGGMLCNAMQIVAIFACIPFLMAPSP